MRPFLVVLLLSFASAAQSVPANFDFYAPDVRVTMGYDVYGFRVLPDLTEYWAYGSGIATGTSLGNICDGGLCITFDEPDLQGDAFRSDIVIGPLGTFPGDGLPVFFISIGDFRTGLFGTVLDDTPSHFAFDGAGSNHLNSSQVFDEFQWWGTFSLEAVRAPEPTALVILLGGSMGLFWVRRRQRADKENSPQLRIQFVSEKPFSNVGVTDVSGKHGHRCPARGSRREDSCEPPPIHSS